MELSQANSVRLPLFTSIIIIASSVLLIFSSQSFADDQSSGCGLGWAVTQRKSLLSSLVRAYTNVTFSSTFGMTSGTSGCAQHSIVLKEKKSLHYTEANYHQLMIDMAQGNGEYLMAYAQVLGCEKKSYPVFAQTLKKNYERIFSRVDIAPQEVLRNVVGQLQQNHVWEQSCQGAVI